jgi:hypothetical protein
MNTNNLHRLIALFESLPDDKVNLEWWRSDGIYCDANISDEQLVDTECGTCGCIVGWLPVLTGIPVAGFKYSQLAHFLDIPALVAFNVATYDLKPEERDLPHRDIVLNRLRGLL